jgi:carbon storage regulator CsrA
VFVSAWFRKLEAYATGNSLKGLMPMLVLTRRTGEKIVVDGPCVIEFNRIKGSSVSVGITAERSVKILRSEIALEQATKPDGAQECGEPRAA